ncbi:MAG: spore germination protein GerW family protein [Actinomycetota bacterium]|nr:spore germination protein GerW family protein [Actinomycetota bacterium]
MNITTMVSTAQDALTVRTVFGEPIEKGAVTIIPAARVVGGIGGGDGADHGGQHGEGGGFGIRAYPAGAYVIRNDKVRWLPAVDPNRIVVATGAVAAVALLARAWATRRS